MNKFEITQKQTMTIPCPKCSGSLTLYRYNPVLKILKERSWYLCKNCKFQETTDEYKQRVFVA